MQMVSIKAERPFEHILKNYLSLTKPRMVLGNLITALAGFFLGSAYALNFARGAAMLMGLAFVIASACVINNCIDRDIDAKMARTKNRALVTDSIPFHSAIIFGVILGVCGIFILDVFVNLLAASTALFGSFAYLAIYSLWGKRSSVHGTLVGAIAGATPPVVGYAAATNRLDLAALILFIILAVWQMPHFYAIAIRRKDEYAAANIPVLPIVKGNRRTKLEMLFYIAAFTLATLALTLFGYTGWIYFTVILLACLAWLFYGLKGFETKNDVAWARSMFFISIAVLLLFSIMVSASTLFHLP